MTSVFEKRGELGGLEPQQGLSRITSVKVQGLFGLYDHVIDLRLDSRVTIIHGPNGVGKTVLLRLLASLFNGQYLFLSRTPFLTFSVTLSDGRTIIVERLEDPVVAGAPSHPIRISLTMDGVSSFEPAMMALDPQSIVRLATQLEREIPWLNRVAAEEWLDMRTNERLSAEELVLTLGDRSNESRQGVFSEPPWLMEARKAVAIHLIETQRLLKFLAGGDSRRYYAHSPEPTPTSAVKSYAAELRQTISRTLARYASESQTLDQTFPQRLLSGDVHALETEELKRQMSELGALRSDLSQIGLVEEAMAYPFNIESLENLDETRRTVMTLYVNDTETKLRVLEDLSRRIGLLVQIINRKFRHKQVAVRENTLVALGDHGEQLDLDALSSGEQHELVLTYDLLFKVRKNSLVLIDEPELSLHVVWQKAFLPDILSIVKATEFDVLVATHSPYIAGDAPDLMVELSDEIALAGR